MLEYLPGLLIGGLAGLIFWCLAKRKVSKHEEEVQEVEYAKETALQFMHNLAQSIAQDPSKEVLLSRINHAIIQGTGALSVCIYLKVSETTLKGMSVEGLFPPLQTASREKLDKIKTRSKLIEHILRSEEVTIGDGIIGEVAQTLQSQLIPVASEDSRIIQHSDPALFIRSLIVAPLALNNELHGVLAVANPNKGRPFDTKDLKLVNSMAEQATIALQHYDNLNERIEKQQLDMDLNLARDVQQMLLPAKYCKTDTLEIHALYQPARKVSGDFYDILHLPNHRTGFAIADVSGKGIPASLLMAICQTSLRHYARMHSSPSEVLKALNKQLSKDTQENMFITMVYGIINETERTLTFARAGHEHPLHITPNSKLTSPTESSNITRQLESDGMALCMVPQEIFDECIEDHTVPFPPGDALHLYTDGVTETPNTRGEEFSSEKLLEVLNHADIQTPEKLNQTILEQLRKFSEGVDRIHDDITLLSIYHKTPTPNS
jgi:sigma-B regulation protein RsbU (phosphoserine phosphatase)